MLKREIDNVKNIFLFLKTRYIFPTIFIFYGLVHFFVPIASGWFEVVYSPLAEVLFLPLTWLSFIVYLPIYMVLEPKLGSEKLAYIPNLLFLMIYFIYLVCYLAIIRRKWTKEYRRFALAPLLVFPLLWLAVLPLGSTNIDRHVSSFPLGAQARLAYAGGAETLRTDSIQLLENTQKKEPAYDELPPSIKKLHGWVMLEHDKNLVLIGIGRTIGMADEFGYIVQKDSKIQQTPNYLEDSFFLRTWKLAEGVYFFER